MKKIAYIIIAIFILFVFIGNEAWGEDVVNIYVHEESGITRNLHPVHGGIPFPIGKLQNISKLKLMQGTMEVPCQFKIGSRWYDNSIKWVWLDFFASVGSGSVENYKLYFNGDSHDILPPMQINKNAEGIIVNTGKIEVKISGKGFNLFDGVYLLDDSGKRASAVVPERNRSGIYIRGKRYKNGKQYPDAYYDSGYEAPLTLEIEEKGPIRSIVKATGRIVDSGKKPIADYICRFYFYNKKTYVKVDLTIVDKYVGVSEHYSLINSFGVKLETGISGNAKYFEISGAPSNHAGQLQSSDFASIYQTGNPNDRWDSIKYSLGGKAVGTGQAHSGKGWVDLSGSSFGVSAGVKYFWQLYPKKNIISGNGLIDMQLYPEDTEPTRLYAGAAKTHSLLFLFHKGKLSDNTRYVLDGFETELFPKCSPEWYCNSKAFGNIPVKHFKVRKPEYQKIVDAYYARFDYVMQKYDDIRNTGGSLKRGNCYGFWNFGDQFEDAWGNEMWEPSHGLYLEFVRTGNLKFLRRANQGVIHWMDVDVTHSNYDGGKHGCSFLGKPRYNPNNAWHNMGAKHEFNFEAVKGLLLADYYHLMGDLRALEVMNECFSYLCMWHALEQYTDDYGVRGQANPMLLSLAKYDMDNTSQALDKAEYIKNLLCKWQDMPDKESSPSCDAYGRGWVPSHGKASGFQSGLALEAFMLYEWITGKKELGPRIVKAAKWLISPEPKLWTGAYNPQPDGKDFFNSYTEKNYGCKYAPQVLMIPAGLGAAFALTGDENFLTISNTQIAGMSALRTTYSKGPKLLGEETRSMPYYLYFLSKDFEGSGNGDQDDSQNPEGDNSPSIPSKPVNLRIIQ